MSIQVKVAATTANLGPGFDTLGMALSLYNEVSLERSDSGLQIEIEGFGKGEIPNNDENLIWKAMEKVFEKQGVADKNFHLKMKNEIPLSRGLGSSASTIVAGLLLANEVCNRPYGLDELLILATEMEGHPDNVAPTLLGGIVVSAMDRGEVLYQCIEPNEDWSTVVYIPNEPLATKRAREVLPTSYSKQDAVFNVSRASMLTLALMRGDLDLVGRMMEDRLHQPYRLPLIEGYDKIFDAAKQGGAKGVALSGAGSTLIAFCERKWEQEVLDRMEDAVCSNSLDGVCKILHPLQQNSYFE